jgi:hypothetical protein
MERAGVLSPHDRRADIDALRVGALLLLILYHLLLAYSGMDFWRVRSVHNGYWADYIITLLRPWRLALVFFIGGVAVRFMLERRPLGAFMWDRASKLLLAFVFAVIVLVPPLRYVRLDDLGLPQPSYLEYLVRQAPFVEPYLGMRLPEFAHAWFLPYLFIYSVAAALAWRFLPTVVGALQRLIERAPIALLVAALAAWSSTFAAVIEPLRPPTNMLPTDLSGHLRWAPVFALGVLLGRSGVFWAKLDSEKWRIWIAMMLLAPLNVGLLWLHLHGHMHDPTIWRVVRGLYGGVALFGVIAGAHWAIRKPSPSLTYASDAILPVYLLHQTCLVIAGDAIVQRGWPGPVEFVVLLSAALGVPVVLYHLFVRYVTPMRVLFGLRAKRRKTGLGLGRGEPHVAPSAP